MHAFCQPRLDELARHPAPDEDCRCGFYAIKSPHDGDVLEAVVRAQVSGESTDRAGLVFGRVHLAGKVIEHTFGYRAEWARIVELIPTTTDATITSALAARLGIAVGRAADTTGMFHAFGEEEVARYGPDQQLADQIVQQLLPKLGVSP